MKLCLSDVVCRFSGARIMCLGMEEELYEIGWDGLYRIEKEENQIRIVEKLPGGWIRRSELYLPDEK